MHPWRLAALVLGLLAFALAAARSGSPGVGRVASWLLDGWTLRLWSMTYFWIGVAFFPAAAWRKGGT